MKKYILGLLIVIILSIGGYFTYQNYFKKTEYQIFYYELTEKDIKELKTYGTIDKIIRRTIEVEGKKIKGEIYVYIRGNDKKQEEIVAKIKQNKHVRNMYKPFNDITVD